ncbi:NlpC/P60 family protein [Streptomyces sannanensis]|uniref:NlpC/P60 family protein n=1 Tax=Streptomyces sannanensis TaxID=285536 RepID=A0ABP6SFF9_9ACTN
MAAAPPERSVSALLTELQTLYRQAETASEAFNATEEQLKKQRAESARLNARLADARLALAGGRAEAGRLAREQYQGHSTLSPYLRLLLAKDPQTLLDQGHLIRRAAAGRAATVARLDGAERRAEDLAARAKAALDVQQALADRQKKERDTVQSKLKQVEKLLTSLTVGQLTELARLEQAAVDKAQRELLESGALTHTRSPSKEGGAAVAYAVRQIGKPYKWGAEGPGSFDCSGLTQQAWASAGRTIPRTSQEQWRRLPRVPLTEVRPGDLVVYFPQATHVAVYLGGGLVIQAPRPGTRVKVSPVAANPLLGAVRPDPAGVPLKSYTPPRLPEGAEAGSDAGYGSATAPPP